MTFTIKSTCPCGEQYDCSIDNTPVHFENIKHYITECSTWRCNVQGDTTLTVGYGPTFIVMMSQNNVPLEEEGEICQCKCYVWNVPRIVEFMEIDSVCTWHKRYTQCKNVDETILSIQFIMSHFVSCDIGKFLGVKGYFYHLIWKHRQFVFEPFDTHVTSIQ
jgi:hypothetical protein